MADDARKIECKSWYKGRFGTKPLDFRPGDVVEDQGDGLIDYLLTDSPDSFGDVKPVEVVKEVKTPPRNKAVQKPPRNKAVQKSGVK